MTEAATAGAIADATGRAHGRRVIVLGIEGSCDDTGVAVERVGGGEAPAVLAHRVVSTWSHHARQADIDKDVAAAGHARVVRPLVAEVVAASGVAWHEVDAIAVTVGPGMMGGLVACTREAVRLAALHGKPLVPVNHLEGHALAAGIECADLRFPFLVLLASGGNCQLALARSLGQYDRLGETIDVAPGQVLDAVARALALDIDIPGAGGAAIERAAAAWHATADASSSSSPLISLWQRGGNDGKQETGCDFSFVPLRGRALGAAAAAAAAEGSESARLAVAAATQGAVVAQLRDRVERALAWCVDRAGVRPTALVVAGGVGANKALRAALAEAVAPYGGDVRLVCPSPALCTDNGRMIAHAGALHYLARPQAFSPHPSHVCLQHEWHLGQSVADSVRAFAPPIDVPTSAIVKRPGADHAAEAADALLRGEIVGFPTETVYGLGANAFSDDAVARIFACKGRPSDNPLIVHVATMEQFNAIVGDGLGAEEAHRARLLIDAFWPGPLTLLVPNAGRRVSPLVTCGKPDVGLRMPDNAVALDFIRMAGVGVAAPSANRSGRPSPTTAAHVADDLGARGMWGVLDNGSSAYGIESTVFHVRDMSIYREGPVTADDISRVLGGAPVAVESVRRKALRSGEAPKAPGMAYRHYAPDTPVTVVKGSVAFFNAAVRDMKRHGRRVGVIAPWGDEVDAKAAKIWYCTPLGAGVAGARGEDALGSLGANLYAALRGLDRPGEVDVILVRAVPDARIGGAVMERLGKASEGSLIEEPPSRGSLARVERLVGPDIVERIRRGRVLVCGVGGAGSTLVDMLVRSGVGTLDGGRIGIIDDDVVQESNLVRMTQAVAADVGRPKVDVVAERARAIAADANVVALRRRITTAADLDDAGIEAYDVVVDAVDESVAKVAVIRAALDRGVPIVSCMGAGNKIDVAGHPYRAGAVAQADACLLARDVRTRLATEGIDAADVPCVYTDAEHWNLPPDESGRDVIGNWPPSYFMASAALLDHVLKTLVGGAAELHEAVRRRASPSH